MAKKKYDVYRSMTGDKEYNRGDIREMEEADAVELVASGALALEGEDPVKREALVQNGELDEMDRSFGHEIAPPPRELSVKVADKRSADKKPVKPE
jgi:hypothetical protein